MINAYTIFGQPIAHSLSPRIHTLFGELTHRRVRYTRTESTPARFADDLRQWQADGGRGCNVTMPFKEQAVELCDRLAKSAERAGSVNTIHMHRDGSLVGHNTDGSGLLVDLEKNLGRPLEARRVLLLGAGGAARGVIGPMLDARPAVLHVANRTPERARALVDRFAVQAPDGTDLDGYGFEALDGSWDIVVNATSLSLNNELPPLPDDLLAPGALAYDMTYGPTDSVFMAWARERGAEVAGGFGMLVEQAADAFEIWEGVRPKMRMAWPRLIDLLKGA